MNDDTDPLKIAIPAFLKESAAPKGPTCADCRFMVIDEKNMVCRRHPPTACVIMVPAPMPPQLIGGKVQQQMGMRPQAVTAWPLVMEDWHCFEHEPAFSRSARTPSIVPCETLAAEPHPSMLPRMPGDDATLDPRPQAASAMHPLGLPGLKREGFPDPDEDPETPYPGRMPGDDAT